jgi:hypothetical protein
MTILTVEYCVGPPCAPGTRTRCVFTPHLCGGSGRAPTAADATSLVCVTPAAPPPPAPHPACPPSKKNHFCACPAAAPALHHHATTSGDATWSATPVTSPDAAHLQVVHATPTPYHGSLITRSSGTARCGSALGFANAATLKRHPAATEHHNGSAIRTQPKCYGGGRWREVLPHMFPLGFTPH